MTDKPYFSDEELTAYLDGEADPSTSMRITEALEHDTALAARLAALEIPQSALREGFEALRVSAPEQPALSQPSKRRFLSGIAAMALASVGGGIIGYTLRAPAVMADWMTTAAAYQSLYTADTLNIPTPTEDIARANLGHVSSAIGHDLTPARIVDGLTFKRAQILGHRNRPLIQIAYLTQENAPMALCIIAETAAETPVEVSEMSGLAAASWHMDGHGYLLIGGQNKTNIRAWAEALRQTL